GHPPHRAEHGALQGELSRHGVGRGGRRARRRPRRVGGFGGAGDTAREDAAGAIADWKSVLPQTKLQADHLHVFEPELARGAEASHVRLNIYPDGGVSRFRVFGTAAPAARRAAVLRQINALDDPEARALFGDVCGAPEWIRQMAAARPFASAAGVLEA